MNPQGIANLMGVAASPQVVLSTCNPRVSTCPVLQLAPVSPTMEGMEAFKSKAHLFDLIYLMQI